MSSAHTHSRRAALPLNLGAAEAPGQGRRVRSQGGGGAVEAVASSLGSRVLCWHAGWMTLGLSIALTVMGIMTISTVHDSIATKQTVWFVMGLGAFVVMLAPRPRQIGMISGFAMAFLTLLLVVLIAPGVPRSLVPEVNGSRSWFDLPLMNFQPSEVAKPAFVLAMAWYLRHRSNFRTWRGLMIPFVMMAVPVVLILKQPDLGTALLFGPTLFAMLVAAGAKLRHIGLLLGLGFFAIGFNVVMILALPEDSSLHLLKPHQRNRILALVSQAQGDERYIHNIGFQGHKAMTLIGAGGLSGNGEKQAAHLIHFNRLPENHNDMIFVVVVNRWGLVGGLALLAMYLALVVAILRVAQTQRDPFIQLSCVGFAALIFTQMAINVGMTMGLFPITGINLPFVSYGGSSLLAHFAIAGLVFNFATQKRTPMMRRNFEFGGAGD